MIKVLPVKHTNLYDVFVGDGWYNHARVYYKNNKMSFVGKGNTRLTKQQVTTLHIKLALLEKQNDTRTT